MEGINAPLSQLHRALEPMLEVDLGLGIAKIEKKSRRRRNELVRCGFEDVQPGRLVVWTAIVVLIGRVRCVTLLS